MPTSDLDLPLLPSAEQIRRREFATIRRGYDSDQVRDYLESVATQVESLERDLKDARLQLESMSAQSSTVPMPAAPEVDPYERISKRFSGLLATADREASRIVDEAKTEADRIKVDAQSTAEAAKQQGTDALESARQEADRVLKGLSTRREALVEQLHEMQSRLLNVADDLQGVIESPGPDAEAIDAALAELGTGTSGDEAEDAQADDAQTDAQHASEPNDAGDEMLDPRYEDLWVSTEGATGQTEDVELEAFFAQMSDGSDDDEDVDDADGVSMDIPDLASMELDFDEGRSDSD